ncbi:MAG: small, acid-soluble spore protein, alpha/beta type [Dorea sp.]|nr:small, acid-soluble spore protein, alpha/beta type [Dorea sp.]
MSKKKEKPIDLRLITPEEKLKYEIAEELGLLDKVLNEGWKSLSSKETGRIGGLITKKRRETINHNKNITNIN